MSTPEVSAVLRAKSRLGSWAVPLLWLALLALSVAIFAGWSTLRLPAALLLGPMIGAIVLGVNGAQVQVPRVPYLGAQALIGAMVAGSITRSILVTFSHRGLDPAGRHAVRAGPAISATGVRDRPGAAHHAFCRQTLAASPAVTVTWVAAEWASKRAAAPQFLMASTPSPSSCVAKPACRRRMKKEACSATPTAK